MVWVRTILKVYNWELRVDVRAGWEVLKSALSTTSYIKEKNLKIGQAYKMRSYISEKTDDIARSKCSIRPFSHAVRCHMHCPPFQQSYHY